MSKIITLRKGLDINLVGKPQESLADAPQASEYALSPLDFEGVTLLVKEGDRVKTGTPLFFNKYNERVSSSPVSGTVAAVNRGEKRKVLSVTVTPDASQEHERSLRRPTSGRLRASRSSPAPGRAFGRMIVQRPLRHHRRPQRHAESGLHLRLQTPRRWPWITIFVLKDNRRTSRRVSTHAQPPGQGASRCAPGRRADALAQGRRTPRLCGQTPRRQRRRADPPRGPGEQGRSGVDGQHPGSGHHRPPVQRRPRRHDEDHRRGRFGDRASAVRPHGGRREGRLPGQGQREATEGGRQRPLHLGQRAHGHPDRAGRLHGLLRQSADRHPRGRQVRTAGLGDAPFREVLRVARLFFVALPEEGLQPRHQHERRRASVRRDGALRAVPADGHLPDVPAEGVPRGRHRKDENLGIYEVTEEDLRCASSSILEDRDSADHPRRY